MPENEGTDIGKYGKETGLSAGHYVMMALWHQSLLISGNKFKIVRTQQET
jgi:hypothetical protein